MIDLIINENGAVTVAHDERALDACTDLQISASGAAVLVGPGGSHPIGTLVASMRDAFRPGVPGRLVRMVGWSIARVSKLDVVDRH